MQKRRVSIFLGLLLASCIAPAETDYVGGKPDIVDSGNVDTKDADDLTDASEVDAGTCVGPHLYFDAANGSCYDARSDLAYGSSARSDCTSRGEHLVTITSLEEQNFVAQIAADEFVPDSGPPNAFWIGLVNQRTDGGVENFKWVDGEPFVYMNWASGAPDHEVCVAEFIGRLADRWDDFNCNTSIPHICER